MNLADHLIRRKQVLGGLTHEYYVAVLQTCAATEKRVTTRIVFPSPTHAAGLAIRRPYSATCTVWSIDARFARHGAPFPAMAAGAAG
jgi:hypothetical protein